MAKKKLNAFYDRNAKEITTEDVEGLLKMQKEAKDKANYEANKADYKAPKFNSLPTLDDTSKKVSTKAPSVSPEQPKTMNVGNKTFKVADNAKKTSIDSGKKLATGKKDEQTEYYNKQIEKRNNLKRSESSLGNYGWEGSLKSIRNKQIAKTDKELSSSYINDVNNEKEVNSAVDKWLNPEYKMTDFERKQAQKLTNDYFKKFNKATGGATKNLKGEEKKRYDRMNELATKSNRASAAVMGSADALGAITLGKGFNKALDKDMAKEVNQRIDREQEVARRQSPLAYNAGYMGTKMGEYAALNKLLDSVPALTKFGQTLNSFGGITKDMFADLLLDTTFETAENAVNGESLGKVSADTAKNIGANLVFNMLPELLGGALKSANPEMADDVVKNLNDAIKNDTPKVSMDAEKALESARQNELDALKEGYAKRLEEDARIASRNNSLELERAARESQADEMARLRNALAEQKKNGIQVYRGYNRSDNPLESNLAKQKTLSDFISKKRLPGTVEPEMLPLEYYTESLEDATNYANHDKLFYDSLRDNALAEIDTEGNPKIWGVPKSEREAWIKEQMDEAYRRLTGREPIFGNGHVDTHTINPQKTLDLTELGDVTNADSVYDLLSRELGLPQTAYDGKDIDSYFNGVFPDYYNDFNTYMLLRNTPTTNADFGSRFLNLMRDNGYDSVKYTEDGYNHYALLNDANNQATKEIPNVAKPEVKEVIPEETVNPVPSLEKPIANEVAEEVAKEVEPTMTAIDYDNAVRDLSERYSIANEVDDLVHDDLAKAITFDSDADREAFEEVYNAFLEDSKNIMNAKNHGEIVDYIRRIDEESRALDNLMGKGYVLDKGSKKELQRIKKNFYDNTRGTVIRLTPDLRHEMGLDGKTIAELNNELRLGKNGIRFSANNGTPIDMLFDELKQASGNVMRDADNSADQINALMEYVESLKNGEAAKMRVGARDLIDEDLFDVLSENVGAYDDALAKLGVRPEGEGLPIREEVPNNITNIFDEEPAVRHMAEDTGIGRTTTEPTDIPRVEEGNLALSPYTNTEELADGTIKTQTGEIKERGYSDSIRNKTDLPDDVKNEFPDFYEVLKNKDTEAMANSIMEKSDTNGALAEAYKRIQNKDAVGIPLGYKVSKALIEEGRREDAVELLHYMSSELTRSGQFSQAAAITLMHEDPMTALRYLQKQMDEINVEGAKKYRKKWKDLELTEDEVSRLGDLEMGDSEGIKEVFDDVYKRLQKEYPSTTWEKFVELTKLGMLLNPRTHIRNTVANSLLVPIRSASDRVSAVGQIMSGVDERTQSLVGGTKAQKKIAGEVYENEMKGLLEGDDKWSDLKGVARDKQVFGDSKVGWVAGEGLYRGLEGAEKLGNAISEMPLVDKLTRGKLSDALKGLAEEGKEGMTDSIIENLRRFDYYLLSKVEDDPFVKKNFTNRLASYMKAQNINNIDDIPMEAKQLAWEEALKATFKDDNRLTRMLAGFKKEAGKFGEVLFPFTKTPANLAMRAVDYSPVGILKAIKDYRDIPIDARSVPKLWDDMSKGMVGSAGILLGYLLRKSGVITGALSDDTDTANFEKQTGKQAYSLHLGDKYYSYDWAQPAGTPMIIGANIYDAINSEGNSENGKLGTIANGALQGSKAAINTWLELSPLQSLGTLFNGSDRSKTFADRAIETVADMPQRLIPSLMGATARTVDPTMRETYDRTSAVNTWVNTAKSKIPAIGDDDNWWNTNVSSKSLPAKYDNWGHERTRSDSTKEAAFAQMVNPGQLSNNNSTPIDNEIGRLGAMDAKAYPSTADRSVTINKQNIKLNNEEYSEYQKNLGEAQYQLAEHFVNSDYYNKFSDDEKTRILGNLYSFANALAKSEQFDYDIAGNSDYKKAYAEYQKGGLDAVADYYATKNVLSDVSEQYTKKNGEGKSFSDLSKEENLKVLTDMVNDGYMTKEEAYDYLPDNKMVNTLSQYGNKGYELYADLVQYGTSDKGDFTNDKVIPVLRQTNVDPKMAGEILYSMNGSSNATKVNKVYKDLGPEGLWDYYNYKEYANLDGENGISNKELTAYLNSRDYMSQDEKRYWFDVLKANKKTKNPY